MELLRSKAPLYGKCDFWVRDLSLQQTEVNEKTGKEGWIRRGKDREQKGERRNFRAIIVDITEFQAFSDSEDFLSLWSFHGGISSGLGWSLCPWEQIFL